jgi:hypothetical protein
VVFRAVIRMIGIKYMLEKASDASVAGSRAVLFRGVLELVWKKFLNYCLS